MPCISLKHRQIFREQILPRIMARIKAKKAKKSPEINQIDADEPQIVKVKVINNASMQAAANRADDAEANTSFTYNQAPKQSAEISESAVEPELLTDGQEIAFTHDEPKPKAAPRPKLVLRFKPTEPTTEVEPITPAAELGADALFTPATPHQPLAKLGKLGKCLSPLFARQAVTTRADLINAESALGGQIFGPIPEGRRREFFHDQRNIWIWHEGWRDDANAYHHITVRYEVCPSGVYKKLSAGNYARLEGAELDNFRAAARIYLETIKQNLYARA